MHLRFPQALVVAFVDELLSSADIDVGRPTRTSRTSARRAT